MSTAPVVLSPKGKGRKPATASNKHVAARLAETALFGPLGPDQLARAAAAMQERSFKPGEVIFCRGGAGRELFLVLEGRVRISINSPDGRALAFNHACKGEIFGEVAVLDGGARSADATALTRVRAAAMSRATLNRIVGTSLPVAQAAIALLCRKLRATSEQLEEVALSPIEKRLARFLLHTLRVRAGDQPGGQGMPDRTPLDLGMSQGELALLIGTSRPTVNTALSLLEKERAIKRVGQKLQCDVDRLTQIAEAIG